MISAGQAWKLSRHSIEKPLQFERGKAFRSRRCIAQHHRAQRFAVPQLHRTAVELNRVQSRLSVTYVGFSGCLKPQVHP